MTKLTRGQLDHAAWLSPASRRVARKSAIIEKSTAGAARTAQAADTAGAEPTESEYIPVETVFFKRVFHLAAQSQCTLTVTTHSRYNLYVNGQRTAYGPCKGDHYRRYCDEVDISPYLKVGDNTLVCEVVSYPPYEAGSRTHKGPDWSMNRACGPCLLVSGYAVSETERVRLSTDPSTWVCQRIDALTPRYDRFSSGWMGYMEQVDAEKQLPQPQYVNKDDGAPWERPATLFDVDLTPYGILPFFELYKRPIPMPYLREHRFVRQMNGGAGIPTFNDMTAQDTVVIPPHTTAAIELDAGVLTTAFIKLCCTGGTGADVQLIYAEAYVQIDEANPEDRPKKGRRDDADNGLLIGAYDVLHLSGGEVVYAPFLFRTFRFVRLVVTTAAEPVTLYVPTFTETGYPLAAYTQPDATGHIDSTNTDSTSTDSANIDSTNTDSTNTDSTNTDSTNTDAIKTRLNNDDWINALWEVSFRTLQRCMHETYEDCPYYEQMQYTMDTRLQILYTYAVSGDTRMAFRTLYDYHASLLPNGMLQSRYPCEVTQVIPPFALDWIFMVYDYFMETGDAAVIERYRPTIESVLAYFNRHKTDGLVQGLDYWEFTDWAPEWSSIHGVPQACAHGASTIINFKYAYALKLTAAMLGHVALPDLAARYRQEADVLCALLHERCYDEAAGLYRDGPDFAEYTQHAQVWAVLAEVVPPVVPPVVPSITASALTSASDSLSASDSPLASASPLAFRQALMRRVKDRGDTLIQCTFPMQFYLFRAYEAVSMYHETAALWDSLKRQLDLGVTTVPEIPNDARSDCHAWGSVLLYEYPRMVLGVHSAEPGYAAITVKPQALYIKTASGTVHTPKGAVTVSYTATDDAFEMRIHHQCVVPVTVVLPNGEAHSCPSGKAHRFTC